MVWCVMVWYGMVWYVMVWYAMLCYAMLWCDMVWNGLVQGVSHHRNSPSAPWSHSWCKVFHRTMVSDHGAPHHGMSQVGWVTPDGEPYGNITPYGMPVWYVAPVLHWLGAIIYRQINCATGSFILSHPCSGKILSHLYSL